MLRCCSFRCRLESSRNLVQLLVPIRTRIVETYNLRIEHPTEFVALKKGTRCRRSNLSRAITVDMGSPRGPIFRQLAFRVQP
jgi:hypothetical protein